MILALQNFIEKYRANRRLLLLIVYVGLFLDNMLLTTVVPIIPEYLLRISHPNSTDMLLHNKISIENIENVTKQDQTAVDFITPSSQFIDNSDETLLREHLFNLKRRQKRDEIEWDSDEWEETVFTTTKRFQPFRSNKVGKSSSSNIDRSSIYSRMRPAKATTSSIDLSDSYESLPDEFFVGFQDQNPAIKLVDEEILNGLRGSKSSMQNKKKLNGAALRKQQYIDEQEKVRHETLSAENVHVGLMFGSKALIQLIANPLVGPLTNKIGYTLPMFFGFVVMFLSTLLFAFGSSFITLWFARALQGIGSACTSTSGMGMLAQSYPNDAERGSAMGIALGGLALGVLIGPPYGGLLYQWSGKELPFILLALLALCDGTLQFLILQPKVDRGEPEGTSIKELAKDPYIIVAAGSITIGNLGIAMLEPSLPLWMMESWSAGSFERGAAFLPASISYLIGTNIFGPLAHKIGRWLSGFIGLVVIGFCLLAIPSAGSVSGLIIPNFFMGFSIGMIDASMFPLMGYIVDVRHVGVYGSIYAIADAAFCFAFALGPFFSGPLVRTVGFPTMMYLIAIINFLYAPLLFFLRRLPENKSDKINTIGSNGEKETIQIDGNPMHYEKIDGLTDLPSDRYSNKNINYNYGYNQNHYNVTSAKNYNYNINSVWED